MDAVENPDTDEETINELNKRKQHRHIENLVVAVDDNMLFITPLQ